MREKVIFINLYIYTYKLSNMCDSLDINKKTYYKCKNSDDSIYYIYKKCFKKLSRLNY